MGQQIRTLKLDRLKSKPGGRDVIYLGGVRLFGMRGAHREAIIARVAHQNGVTGYYLIVL
jgi:hypothetical protein